MPVRRAFTVTSFTTGTPAHNRWDEFEYDHRRVSQNDLALAVADYIMTTWFGGTPDDLAAWRNKVNGTPHANPQVQQHLSDIVQSQLRLPADPCPTIDGGPLHGQEQLDHLEGLVGEHLWHLCAALGVLSAQPRLLADLGFRVTDKGPDGFAILEPQPGVFEYRLWEVKKNSTTLSPKSTVDKAAGQLQRRAPDYLQELAQLGKYERDPLLQAFFQKIVYHWRNQTREANAGIAVITSRGAGRAVPFDTFGTTYLKGFQGSDPLQGLIMNMQDLRAFSILVRDVIWTGL